MVGVGLIPTGPEDSVSSQQLLPNLITKRS